MNESNPFNSFSLTSICRVCLKSSNSLYTIQDNYKELYRSIVDEIYLEEYNMKYCIYCHWMFLKFSKFRQQCQSANSLLKQVAYMDLNPICHRPNLVTTHNFTTTDLEVYNSPLNTIRSTCTGNDNQNDTQSYVTIPIINDTGSNDTNDSLKSEIFENDTQNNEPFNDNDEDEMPLQQLRKIKYVTDKNTDFITSNWFSENSNHSQDMAIDNSINDITNDTQKYVSYNYDTHHDNILKNEQKIQPAAGFEHRHSEKHKKSKKQKLKHSTDLEEQIKQEVELLRKESVAAVKSKKRVKVLKEGFTSRMVQETDEYIVIKLTKEQVLQEMEERVKSESYLRSPFRCEKCAKGFNFKDVLESHLEKHSMKNGSFECDMCGQYCRSSVSLRGHIKSHTTRYKCKVCDQVRLSRQHLLEHHAITHTSAPLSYNCDYCKFTTNKRTVMQRHVKGHATGESHACHLCGKLFKSVESLRLHTVRHDKSSRFKCDRCDATFVYQSLLRKHVLCVHERREFYCVECDVQFKSGETLKLHFKKAKRHRDLPVCSHECAECPLSFPAASTLAAHMSAAHNAPKPHACKLCRRLYSSRDALRTHTWRAHKQKEARAACHHCGSTFARKSTLKIHMGTHTVERSHICQCGATFARDATLQNHIQAKHKSDMDQDYKPKIEL